jgi:eukaryotic-like serine/threonine-protein kinase
MGQVYRANDTTLGRDVALKILPAELAANPESFARFQREARVVAALNHPHIVTIFSVEEAEGIHFLTMELVEGQSLDRRIRGEGLPETQIIQIGASIADALAAAHAKGIVHRDLKPANVMVNDEGWVKVLDFGLAKDVNADAGEHTITSADITKAGAIMGTPAYMSPEQISGRPLDHRTDIFSLGVVMHEIATGRRPFSGTSSAELISAILRDTPPPVSDLRPDLPAALTQLIHQCLAKLPEDRVQTAREVSKKLREMSQATPASGSRASSSIVSGADATLISGFISDNPAPTPTRPQTSPHQSPAQLETAQDPNATTRSSWKMPALLAAVFVAAIAGYFIWHAGSRRAAPTSSQPATNATAIHSIAVLPLANHSGDSKQDYFAEGMTDELTTELATISQLRVISRGSVAQFQDGHRPATSEIAKLLNVDAVIEGSVIRSGDRVRINAQLIDAHTDTNLWAKSFERQSRDVLALQDELASSIAREIHVKLTPTEASRLATAPTIDPAAHDAYLKGRYFFNRPSDENLQKAITEFETAVRIDPKYALAYSGLSDAYLWAGYNEGVLTASQAKPKAKAAAEKAIELDDDSAEAHTSLAVFKFFYEFDWVGSEKEFRRAFTLNPNYAFAHDQLACRSLFRDGSPNPSQKGRELLNWIRSIRSSLSTTL